MVKTSTSYSPKVRPMNSKTINRSGNSIHDNKITTTAATTSTSYAPMYSKSVDTKFHSRAFDYTNSTKLSPRRDNSAVLRAVSASASSNNTVCFATASRLNKYRLQQQQHQTSAAAYKSNEMFEQQTHSQPEAKQPNTFGKYENEPFSKSNGCGVGGITNTVSSADDCKNNQMVVITLNGTNGAASAQQKQVNRDRPNDSAKKYMKCWNE